MPSSFVPVTMRSSPSDRRRRRGRRPHLEPLEDRNLLSGAGSLDPGFGSGGIVNTSDHPSAVFVQSGGKILTVGWTTVHNKQAISLVRYDSSGRLDPTFGTKGQVTSQALTRFNGAALYAGTGTANDGKIVVDDGLFDLARFNADGSLDTSFGRKGVATATLPAGSWSPLSGQVVVQPDGKILTGGSLSNPLGTGANHMAFALARYNANGSPDTTFGSGGFEILAPGPGDSQINDLQLLPDGRIVVAAGVGLQPGGALGEMTFAVARLNANGSLDNSFGPAGTGVAYVPAGEEADGIAIQPDGSIVAVGRTGRDGERYQFLVARFSSDGALDPTFGTSGIATPPLDVDSGAYAVALQADGGIVAGGYAGAVNAALVRFDSLGHLDSSFGGGGIVLTSLGYLGHFSVTIQPADGKILTTGIRIESGPTSQYLARYLGTSTAGASLAKVGGLASSPASVIRTAAASGIGVSPDESDPSASDLPTMLPAPPTLSSHRRLRANVVTRKTSDRPPS